MASAPMHCSPIAPPMTIMLPLQLTGNQLLPAVDVVSRAGEGGVGHDVCGKRGDVGRSDDAPNGKRGAKLIAAIVEFTAEERCGQRCIDCIRLSKYTVDVGGCGGVGYKALLAA